MTDRLELTSAQRVDVELLACGKQTKSRTLKDLALSETPQAAHALLLQSGIWNEAKTPYAERLHINMRQPELPIPDWGPDERLDLTHLTSYAIDDEGNQDPDDAIAVEDLGNGLTRLWVHVADVAALVAPNSPLDEEARSRGATLYLPDCTIGMLPPDLVQKVGLGLNQESVAFSIAFDLDEEGNADTIDLHLTKINVQRMTYTEAQTHLEQGHHDFVKLATLARASRELREQEGAIQMDFPEVRIQADQETVSISELPKPEMRFVVQECMTLAGWSAAIFADDHDIPLPFATQDMPYRQVYGDSLWADWSRRKTLSKTRFQPSPAPHYSMGFDLYAQVTSPMRRYLDLLVHQQLRAFLLQQELLSPQVISTYIAQTQLNSDAIRQAERLSRRHHLLRYVLMHPDRVWKGIVVERKGKQAIILIPELALDVPVVIPSQPGTEINLLLRDVYLPELTVRAVIAPSEKN